MEKVVLNAEKRERTGKGGARSLRASGSVPGVMYRKGIAQSIQLSGKELSSFLSKTAGEQVVVSLKFSDDSKQAIVKDYQKDPITGSLIHVDFQEVSATDTLKVMVHVVIKGEAIGVKRDKGILQHGLREVEVECLPDKIPGHFDVDVTSLLIGQSIHVNDLKPGEGVRILSEPHEVLATIIGVKEEAAPAEAAAAVAEPEVIKKGKKTEEEAKEKK